MFRPIGWTMRVRRLKTHAGLAAAIVPCAIIVHLIAEAAAVGRDGLGLAFLVRHAYFAILFGAAATWFGMTAGIGRPLRERRRHCALMRADLRGDRNSHGIATLVAANLAFFVVTQVAEGVPVATGAVALSLVVAFACSIGAALFVFFFGRAGLRATIDAVINCLSRRRAQPAVWARSAAVVTPRHATLTYTLARPNRPPPLLTQF